MSRLLLVIAILFSFALSVPGQVKSLSREAIDSIKNRRVLDYGESVLAFAVKTIDFGTIYETDSVITLSFLFENVSRERVVIRDITANCGCIDAFCEKPEYEPGERGAVFIKFSPKGRSGTVDKNIFIYTSISDDRPVAKLTLLGNVVDLDEWRHLPLSLGNNLRLKRKEVTFEQVIPGISPQVRIPCANVGTADIRLSSKLLPCFMRFSTEPTVISPGEEGDMVITIDGKLLPQMVKDSYNIVIDGVEGRISDRIIKIKIEKNKK